MKRLWWIGLSLVGGAAALLATSATLRAADHRDAPAVRMEANISADINDVYTWMSSDASKLNLVMTVSPFAEDGAQFSDAVQYVFHVNSMAAFGGAATETLVMCTFDADQVISCWAGDDEYVTGDASAAEGVASESGALKVFAGPRNDPFFFNLNGFVNAVDTVKGVAGKLSFDEEGCPDVDPGTSSVVVDMLQTEPNGDPAVDDFAGANTLAIVVELDKTVVNGGGDIVGVWASTNVAE
jgi:hypothetical protein